MNFRDKLEAHVGALLITLILLMALKGLRDVMTAVIELRMR